MHSFSRSFAYVVSLALIIGMSGIPLWLVLPQSLRVGTLLVGTGVFAVGSFITRILASRLSLQPDILVCARRIISDHEIYVFLAAVHRVNTIQRLRGTLCLARVIFCRATPLAPCFMCQIPDRLHR